MANNTATATIIKRARHQFQALFDEMFLIRVTVTGQDSVAAGDGNRWTISTGVDGLKLGDMVLGWSDRTADALFDGDSLANLNFYIPADDTLTMVVIADSAIFAQGSLTNDVFNVLVGRPAW
jgi:hypothetical protein